jgi:L-lactate dehydrogenase complex protein LldG
MSAAREQMLELIRTAVRSGVSTDQPSPPVASTAKIDPPPTGEELVALFIDRARACGATVTPCHPTTLNDALADACARHRARRLVIPPGLPKQWHPPGIELITDNTLTPQQLDELDGAITGAAAGIAESGTIALDGAPDQGRRALTLIPDLHVCIVQASRIVATLPDALTHLAESVHPGRRAITLISGPSSTADIELRRVQGVHGPRHLEIIVPSRQR